MFGIFSEYNLSLSTDSNYLCNTISPFKFTNVHDDQVQFAAENIKILLYYRDGSVLSGDECILNKEELNTMLDYFCTCLH